MNSTRHGRDALHEFATAALCAAGLERLRAAIVAEVLVEGDLLGHTTHGLQLLGAYLGELAEGRMTKAGEPERIGEALWDGNYLPGPWLVVKAMDELFARGDPVSTLVIRRSHHIGCLAAYLKRATDRGRVLLLTCSDPSVASVAPHGATAGRFTPNPIAAGFPTAAGPVWMDVSASTTTNGMVARLKRSGGKLPGKWLIDAQGGATDDPQASSTILPLGGLELGYKGFALALLVEALTSGLAGHGRADGERRWGAAVFLMAIDPDQFGGRSAFEREMGWLAEACRGAPARPGESVRLPGERAAQLREAQLRNGVRLHPDVLASLEPWAKRLGLRMPEPL